MNAPIAVRLRPARPADAAALAALWGRSLRELCAGAYRAPELEHAAAAKTPETLERLIRAERLFLVAEADGIPVGLACATFELGSFALYVSPDCAGRGVGSRLLRAVEAAARAAGLRRFAFHSSANALEFYRKRGYRVTGAPVSSGAMPAATPVVKEL